MAAIDLNADLGEGSGPCRLRTDLELLPLVSSANVAAGFHAGDPSLIAALVSEARKLGVVIGAHPGYPDRYGFGRRELAASPDEVAQDLLYQVAGLEALARAGGWPMRYLKPHGALYHRLVRDRESAETVVTALCTMATPPVVLTQAQGALAAAATAHGLRVAGEAFLDRGYRADGTLIPRGSQGAVLTDVDQIVDRAERLAVERVVVAEDGTCLPMPADSCCIHGDGATARAVLEGVRNRFAARGIRIQAFATG